MKLLIKVINGVYKDAEGILEAIEGKSACIVMQNQLDWINLRDIVPIEYVSEYGRLKLNLKEFSI
jgi:hypothetical protein